MKDMKGAICTCKANRKFKVSDSLWKLYFFFLVCVLVLIFGVMDLRFPEVTSLQGETSGALAGHVFSTLAMLGVRPWWQKSWQVIYTV